MRSALDTGGFTPYILQQNFMYFILPLLFHQFKKRILCMPEVSFCYGGTDFTVPQLQARGVSFTATSYPIVRSGYNSAVMDELHTLWDINKFKKPHLPVDIGPF